MHWNTDLLNKLVTRVKTLEALAALVTTETKQALDAVNGLNVGRDHQLREELNSMAEKLKTGFAVLEATATSAQSGSGTDGPDVMRIGTAFDGLQAKMTNWTERIQAQLADGCQS